MPDLSLKASHEFWSEYVDPIIYKVLTFMESVEPWTLDGDAQLEKALEELGNKLDTLENKSVNQLNKENLFIQIGCNIKMSRTLRLLQACDTLEPGSASKILVHAEENSQSPSDTAGIFLRRNIIFERLRLLSRVFSSQRFAMVVRALENEEHD